VKENSAYCTLLYSTQRR